MTTETTCTREIELEIPAENVQKTSDKVARDIARIARIPGFRPGKAPLTLVRRKFAEDIQGEVMQSLVPEYLEKALEEKKLVPVTRPQVNDVQFKEGEALKVRAVFEVLPEIELGNYKDLQVQVEDVEAGDAQVEKTLEEMRERMATYVPVEGRAAQDGDYVVMKLTGTPVGEGEPVEADDVMAHIGGEETLETFTEYLRGVNGGDTKKFRTEYPADYPDPKLAGKTYDYVADVHSIKEKKLPELNDEFAKDNAGENGPQTLEELRGKIRESLEAHKEQHLQSEAREKILETLVKQHEFPVPQALVEGQIDLRLERMVRQLASQGVDPRAVNVDWAALRERQRERAANDVKAELLLDRIGTAENIDVSEEEVEKEIAHMAEHSGESATALRARLTKQGSLDTMKSKLRSDKVIDWLYRTARIEKTAKAEK